jgi:hypothetical protein
MTDKRKVTTDALETLGTVIGLDEKRDAIHLAVEPIEAAAKLYPGQDVGIVEGKASATAETKLGIVDPFLKSAVLPGERFWLVVYPRQIQSLRHVWSHPGFEDEAAPASGREASEKWLREWCEGEDTPGYERTMEALRATLEGRTPEFVKEDEDWMGFTWDEDYLHFRGTDAHAEIPQIFWRHVEVVLGVTIPMDRRADSFSCSC